MEPHRGTPAAYQPHAENPRRPEGSSASPRIQQTFQTANSVANLLTEYPNISKTEGRATTSGIISKASRVTP